MGKRSQGPRDQGTPWAGEERGERAKEGEAFFWAPGQRNEKWAGEGSEREARTYLDLLCASRLTSTGASPW